MDVTQWVVGDIGGTHSRIAVVNADHRPGAADVVLNDTVTGIEEILRDFLAARSLAAPSIGVRLALACPIDGDTVRFTNRDWAFSVSILKHDLGVAALSVVNDFTAIALALPYLDTDQVVRIGDTGARADGPRVVLGPGTGLGVAASVPCAGGWWPLASEGGHATLSPLEDDDSRIIDHLRAVYGHVSAERVLTGPGLRLLYEAERALAGARPTTAPSPAEITRLAAGFADPVAVRVMERFFSLLGGFAGNLALTFGASGGVYLAGGILPRFPQWLAQSRFRASFEAKGRFRAYLRGIATLLIMEPQPALIGLARPLPDGVAIDAR